MFSRSAIRPIAEGRSIACRARPSEGPRRTGALPLQPSPITPATLSRGVSQSRKRRLRASTCTPTALRARTAIGARPALRLGLKRRVKVGPAGASLSSSLGRRRFRRGR